MTPANERDMLPEPIVVTSPGASSDELLATEWLVHVQAMMAGTFAKDVGAATRPAP